MKVVRHQRSQQNPLPQFQPGDRLVRLEVRDNGGGIAAEERDHVFERDGIRLFVDPKSYVYLKGTELDFVRSMMGYGFKFNNPNVTSLCGCKQSFSV